MSPSSWLSRETHAGHTQFATPCWSEAHSSDTKSAFVTPAAPPPLRERAHVDTPHTVCPPLARTVPPQHPDHQVCVGIPLCVPLMRWAEPRTTRNRGHTSPRADYPAPGFPVTAPELAQLSARSRSLFRLVLISLHASVPRGTVLNPAPAVSDSESCPSHRPGTFPRVRGPRTSPRPTPPCPGSGSAGCRHPFPSGPRNQQKGNRRNGEADPGWDFPRPVNKRYSGRLPPGLRAPREVGCAVPRAQRGLVSARGRPGGTAAHRPGRSC